MQFSSSTTGKTEWNEFFGAKAIKRLQVEKTMLLKFKTALFMKYCKELLNKSV